MNKLIMSAAALALFVSGPAYAGCGSHGGYSGGYSAPKYSSYSAKPRVATTRPASPAKVAKLDTSQRVAADGSAKPETDKAKPAVTPAASGTPVKTASAETATSTPVQAPVEKRECKQYSATIGAMISVQCE
jgi:hypothetical protein